MKKNWNLQTVAVFTLIISIFFWFLVLPAESKASRLVLVPLTIALAEGVYIFIRGFVLYRKYRVLAGLPRSAIRSLAMGPVEVHGKAFGEQRLVSPLSRTSCFYYEVLIKARGSERDSEGKNTRVSYYEIDQGGVPFYLQDGTGSVRVYPQGLECDLLLQAQCQAAEEGLNLRYLMLKTGLAKNPSGRRDQDLMGYAQSVIGRTGGDPRNLTSCTFDEYCVLPDRWYDLTGTCIENPNPDDAQARDAIVKGKEETTFLISWRSEAGIEGALHKKALLSIFGGGGLMIASFALILRELGLL